jgi:DNA-binding beta-propeller fold protein YncE
MRVRWIAIAALAVMATACGRTVDDVFYANADGKLIRIQSQGVQKVTISTVGPTGLPGCGAMARSRTGTLYSICGEGILKPGPQQLATIDAATGRATTVGKTVDGLQIMGMKFGPDDRLYAVGDANPASPTFNSLYTVDVNSGAVTRVGPTSAPSFFHDFALDRTGTMYATSSDALYTIDLKTGTATKMTNFVGGGMVMGLSFNADQSKLYATDFKRPASDVYVVDIHTGFLTPLGSTGFPFAHGLAATPR